MPEQKNKSFNVILVIICLFTAIFSSTIFAKCVNVEKSLHAYPNYNQTWLKLSENLNSETRHLVSNTLNENLSSEYGDSIIVDIPTSNKMVVYTETNLKVNNIVKMIDVLPTLEFKRTAQNSQWANTNISGKDIKKADITALNEGEWAVAIEFTKDGAEKFADLTKSIVGQQLAIFYDGNLISAPVIKEEITGGKAIINAGENAFTYDEAQNMAGTINSANISYEIIKVGVQNIVILVVMGLLFIISLGTIIIFIVSKFKEIADKGKCLNCGHINKNGQKFCSKCGNKL